MPVYEYRCQQCGEISSFFLKTYGADPQSEREGAAEFFGYVAADGQAESRACNGSFHRWLTSVRRRINSPSWIPNTARWWTERWLTRPEIPIRTTKSAIWSPSPRPKSEATPTLKNKTAKNKTASGTYPSQSNSTCPAVARRAFNPETLEHKRTAVNQEKTPGETR